MARRKGTRQKPGLHEHNMMAGQHRQAADPDYDSDQFNQTGDTAGLTYGAPGTS